MAWARAEGVELTGPNGLLTGVTKRVLETVLETETAAEPRDERVTQPAQAVGTTRNGPLGVMETRSVAWGFSQIETSQRLHRLEPWRRQAGPEIVHPLR